MRLAVNVTVIENLINMETDLFRLKKVQGKYFLKDLADVVMVMWKWMLAVEDVYLVPLLHRKVSAMLF